MIIVVANRLQQWLLSLGLVISAMLLVRFAVDFSGTMRWWLAGPLWLLVIAALGVGIANLLGPSTPDSSCDPRLRKSKRLVMLAAIPLAFLASSLDCMGLSLQGCTAFCTLVKLALIPLIAIVCTVAYFNVGRAWLTIVSALAFISLFPHCVCYNVGNAWWIDRIGASPLCYSWGFVVGVIAVSALRRGEPTWTSLWVCGLIISGATGFFVTHHFFHYPW